MDCELPRGPGAPGDSIIGHGEHGDRRAIPIPNSLEAAAGQGAATHVLQLEDRSSAEIGHAEDPLQGSDELHNDAVQISNDPIPCKSVASTSRMPGGSMM